jgi:hypothetical protein
MTHDDITKTETTYREYDDRGNLIQEVTTTIVTRTPPQARKPAFGFVAVKEPR